MGERKGVNKYYPPDYDPSKGGLNKFQGTHALRERARKLHMGILIIRFEMPYNIWCDGCENHIGTGVRYNAEKKKVGMYYSTPIYQFRMKCHLCDNYFEIKTDPANLDYEIVSGARRQERRWDPTENEQVVPEDKNVTRKMAADAMFRLEHGVDDKKKSSEIDPAIRQLEEFQTQRWHDDYGANQALRAAMRVKRKEAKAQAAKDASYNFLDPLLPPDENDAKTAKLLQFTQSKTSEELHSEKRSILDAQSVFARLKTKKVPSTAKKAFAQQSLTGIVSQSQKNFTNYKNTFKSQNLGIIKRKNTLDLNADSSHHIASEVITSLEAGSWQTEDKHNLLDQNGPVASDSPPASPHDVKTHVLKAEPSASCSSADQSSVETNEREIERVPTSSQKATSSVHNSLGLLAGYTSSTSDSE